MNIIGVTGLIGSGKGTIADFLIEEGYTKLSFADALKDAASKIFGWDRELIEGSTPESRAWREEIDEWWAERLETPDFSPRQALQKLGTEAMRMVFHDNIWVSVLERKIKQMAASEAVKVVIPDVRFPNEIECIKRLGGQIVRVQRGDLPPHWESTSEYNRALRLQTVPSSWMIEHRKWLDDNVHISEWAWIGVDEPNHVIFNNAGIELLRECARQLAAQSNE